MARSPLTQARTFHLDAPVAAVVPLFTADGERAWAPGWNPQILSGDTERGSAFRTVTAQGAETVWVVADYRPAQGRATYARVAAGSNVGLVDVDCRPGQAGGTDVTVRYTLTGLNDTGDAFVREFLSDAAYEAMIQTWAQLTQAALAQARHPR